jgi:hypothetical protein
LGKQEI